MKTRKIIASDIDGTLLPYGQKALDPELFNLIEDFTKKGVLFVPASGRGIYSIRQMFAPVAEKISYLSENGSVVWDHDKIIKEFPFPEALLREVIQTLYDHPNLECFITSARNSYIISDNPEHSAELKKHVNPDSKTVRPDSNPLVTDTFDTVEDTIVKATAFCFPENADLYFDELRNRFGDYVEVAKAGPNVIDFVPAGKGDGLNVLIDYHGLTPRDTFTFGDNYNDISMLQASPNSYVVETKDPELLRASRYQTRDPIEELKKIYTKL